MNRHNIEPVRLTREGSHRVFVRLFVIVLSLHCPCSSQAICHHFLRERSTGGNGRFSADLAPIVAVCQAGLSFCVLWVWWISRACKQLFDVTFFVNCSAVFIYFRILERNGLIA